MDEDRLVPAQVTSNDRRGISWYPSSAWIPNSSTLCFAVHLLIISAAPLSAADLLETTRLFHGGKYAECVTACDKAIAENDFSENFRLLKLRAEMELGRYPDALQTLDEALKRFAYSIQ